MHCREAGGSARPDTHRLPSERREAAWESQAYYTLDLTSEQRDIEEMEVIKCEWAWWQEEYAMTEIGLGRNMLSQKKDKDSPIII